MLNSTSILQLLKRPRIDGWIYDLAEEVSCKGFVWNDLLDLTLHHDKQTAFHATWLLDTIIALNPSQYAHYLPQITKYARQTTNASCKRSFARIIMFCTSDKNSTELSETDLEPTVELCFDWLIDPHIKVAIKASASQALYNLSNNYDWIAGELQSQLQFLMQNGSPAIQATGRRLLSKLQKKK